MVSYILAFVVGALVLAADQYTKYLIVSSNIDPTEAIRFIPGVINLTYVENEGGAWGILQGHTWALLAITIAIMLICLALLFRWGSRNKTVFWAMSLILFGGIGNMIDRIFRDGKVVDFLQFDFWRSYPVFNIADCAIVIGVGILLLYFVVDTYKELKNKKMAPVIDNKENEENNQ